MVAQPKAHFPKGVGIMSLSSSIRLFSLLISILLFFFTNSIYGDGYPLKVLSLESPVLELTPFSVPGYLLPHSSPEESLLCERVQISGISRLNILSYASSFKVNLVPSVVIPERLHKNILVCYHWNKSLEFCQCETDDWRTIKKGACGLATSPFEDTFIDVKFIGDVPGQITLTVEDEFQQWRIICITLGFSFMLLAPFVSRWAPFYYSSSMAIGIFLVIIILLFQGMKLIPTGRKNAFYVALYGSVLGAGTFLLHCFSMLVNSFLSNFGFSEEMHHLVYVLFVVGIIIAGAALGYWMVRKFVISDDGTVDIGIAHFVKWAMWLVSATCFWQSTADTYLAVMAFASSLGLCFLIRSFKFTSLLEQGHMSWDSSRYACVNPNRAMFLRRSGSMNRQSPMWDNRKRVLNSSKGIGSSILSPQRGMLSKPWRTYYSTFHRTPRRKMSKREFEDLGEESTGQAIAELASSPDFHRWMIDNSERIQVLPADSSEESMESSSESTGETTVHNSWGPLKLFN